MFFSTTVEQGSVSRPPCTTMVDGPLFIGGALGIALFYLAMIHSRKAEEERNRLLADSTESPEPDFVPSALASYPEMVGSVQRDILNQLVLIGKMNYANACASLQAMAQQYAGRLNQPEFATAVNSYLENVDESDPDARSIQKALAVMRSAQCAPKLLMSPLRSDLSFPSGITTQHR